MLKKLRILKKLTDFMRFVKYLSKKIDASKKAPIRI